MMPSDRIMVVAQDLIQVIFDDTNLIWLKSMWDVEGTTQAEMVEILIMLALLKIIR
jgi:hypothetical protein